MFLLVRYLILLALIGSIQTIPHRDVAYRLVGKKVETPEMEHFLSNMEELNRLQAEIFEIEPENGLSALAADDTTQYRPEKLPFLFEGDIFLTDEQFRVVLSDTANLLRAKKGLSVRHPRSMTSSLAVRWVRMPIPFFINRNTGVSESAVLAGINKWQQETCLTFQRLNSYPTVDALVFIGGTACWSYIGRIGVGPQEIMIGTGCTSLGTVTHEIGHALGLYHEQARYDRDDYISLFTRNIQPSQLSQFSKQSRQSLVDYGVPYDYGSVMHYDQTSFTANGGLTIETKDDNYQSTIGQRLGPSFDDIKKVNFAYCNSTCTTVLPCLNGGYTDPKDCSKCRCPDGLSGRLCNEAPPNPSACGSSNIQADNILRNLTMIGAGNCAYLITAPAGTFVFFQITQFSFTRTNPCSSSYLEIKYKRDLTVVGARFCLNYPTISRSESNQLVVLYKGNANTRFTLQYRNDPLVQTTTTTSTTTTTTTPSTSTTTTTTASPTPRTTSTTASTSSAPVETTTLFTTSTSENVISTFFPTTVKTTVSPCTDWTQCSALCGGCGTRSRRCGVEIQTVYCNTQPCATSRPCCLPFFFGEGFCFRPYRSVPELAQQEEEDVSTMTRDEMIEGSGELNY